MISRVADHCFWLGRYLERGEATARMLDATLRISLDAGLVENPWQPIIVVAGESEAFAKATDKPMTQAGREVMPYLTWDQACDTSMANSIAKARWNAKAIRDVLSSEVWRACNDLYLYSLDIATKQRWHAEPSAVYRHVRDATQLALGLVRSTMLHDEAMDFLWLGVLLERVNQTARLLDVHYHTAAAKPDTASPTDRQASRHIDGQLAIDTAVWMTLLSSLGGTEAYMKQASGVVSAAGVAQFLVFEPRFPRSVAYCVASATARMADIRPADADDLPGGRALRQLRELSEFLATQKPAASATPATLTPAIDYHALLTAVVGAVHAICNDICADLL